MSGSDSFSYELSAMLIFSIRNAAYSVMEQAFFFFLFFSLSINTTRILNLTVCSASHTIKKCEYT